MALEGYKRCKDYEGEKADQGAYIEWQGGETLAVACAAALLVTECVRAIGLLYRIKGES
jgi:hypothetical protein